MFCQDLFSILEMGEKRKEIPHNVICNRARAETGGFHLEDNKESENRKFAYQVAFLLDLTGGFTAYAR